MPGQWRERREGADTSMGEGTAGSLPGPPDEGAQSDEGAGSKPAEPRGAGLRPKSGQRTLCHEERGVLSHFK